MVELVWEFASCGRGVIIRKGRGHILEQNIYFSYYLKCNLCSFFGHLVVAYCSMSVASVMWLA